MKRVELPFGTVTLHTEGYVHAVLNEGITLDAQLAGGAMSHAEEHFQGPYGLIDDRLNSFSIDFGVFEFAKAMPRLAAIAVVVRDETYAKLAETEVILTKGKPYRIFRSLDEARAWLLQQLAACRDTTGA